jgi:hypothetical protein
MVPLDWSISHGLKKQLFLPWMLGWMLVDSFLAED